MYFGNFKIIGLCNNMTCNRQVVVLDFPPRLSVEEDQQKLLRMAYHSVCADQGMCKITLICLKIDLFTAMLLNNHSQS